MVGVYLEFYVKATNNTGYDRPIIIGIEVDGSPGIWMEFFNVADGDWRAVAVTGMIWNFPSSGTYPCKAIAFDYYDSAATAPEYYLGDMVSGTGQVLGKIYHWLGAYLHDVLDSKDANLVVPPGVGEVTINEFNISVM